MENKTGSSGHVSRSGKYFKYAIGEIILVVIGILIALNINNWNTIRLDKLEGEVIKQNILEEFTENQLLLNTSNQLTQSAFDASFSLIKLTGSETSDLSQHNLDSLFNYSLMAEDYHPTINSLDDILQSGRMKLLNNDELKNTLQSWQAEMEQLKSYKSSQTSWQNNFYLPYLMERMSYIQMDLYNNKSWARQSKIETDYYPMFQDIKLENLLDNNLYLLEYLIDRMDSLKKIQKRIIELTSTNQ